MSSHFVYISKPTFCFDIWHRLCAHQTMLPQCRGRGCYAHASPICRIGIFVGTQVPKDRPLLYWKTTVKKKETCGLCLAFYGLGTAKCFLIAMWNMLKIVRRQCWEKDKLCCERGTPPRLGPAARSGVQGETVALVGPITPKAKIHYRLETTELDPYYGIRDIQSLKDRYLNVININHVQGNNNQRNDTANVQ